MAGPDEADNLEGARMKEHNASCGCVFEQQKSGEWMVINFCEEHDPTLNESEVA